MSPSPEIQPSRNENAEMRDRAKTSDAMIADISFPAKDNPKNDPGAQKILREKFPDPKLDDFDRPQGTILPGGNAKSAVNPDGSYLVRTPAKDGKLGDVVETQDARGITRQYSRDSAGNLKVQENGKPKDYKEPAVDKLGNFSYKEGDKKIERRLDGTTVVTDANKSVMTGLDGTKVETDLKTKSRVTTRPDGTTIEERPEKDGLRTTTTVKLSESMVYNKPTEIMVPLPFGEQKLPNVSETSTTIQREQNLDMSTTHVRFDNAQPSAVSIDTAEGKLEFIPSEAVFWANAAGDKPTKITYVLPPDGKATLTPPGGKEAKVIMASKINQTTQDDGALVDVWDHTKDEPTYTRLLQKKQ